MAKPVHTFELYHLEDTTVFTEPYARSRAGLDYTFHSNYTLARQRIQDEIVGHFLRVEASAPDHSRPWIMFTGGAPGVGKSTSLRWMHASGIFPLDRFVIVDPDAIRTLLPEWADFVKEDPLTAATRTQQEAGFIAEIIQAEALTGGRSVLVDGTFRNVVWYSSVLNKLRQEYPQHGLAIMLVTAAPEVAISRIARRAAETGRDVPRELLEESLAQVPISFSTLSPLADFSAVVVNDNDNDCPELPPPQTWQSFRSVFMGEEDCGTPRPGDGGDVLSTARSTASLPHSSPFRDSSSATPTHALLDSDEPSPTNSATSPPATSSDAATSRITGIQAASTAIGPTDTHAGDQHSAVLHSHRSLRNLVSKYRNALLPSASHLQGVMQGVLATQKENECGGVCQWGGYFRALRSGGLAAAVAAARASAGLTSGHAGAAKDT